MIFEVATRNKVRFQTDRGNLTCEDLWDMSLTSLNTLAKSIKRKLKNAEEEDFLETSQTNTEEQLQFDIVLHVLNVKKQEKEDRENASRRKEERNKLMEILHKKELEQLDSLTPEEIKAKLAEL